VSIDCDTIGELLRLIEVLEKQAQRQLDSHDETGWQTAALRLLWKLNLNSNALQTRLRDYHHHPRGSLDQQYLLLPHYGRDATHVSALGVERNEVDLSFYLLMIEAKSVTDESGGEGLLFRFDSPHASGADGQAGNHSYWHGQLTYFQKCENERANPIRALESVHWHSDNIPALPVPATCPITLLLCLLKSVYGRGYLTATKDLQWGSYLKVVEMQAG